MLKLWLRELAEPLVPNDLYEKCIQSSEDGDACVAIVERLPAINRASLKYLIDFLRTMASHESRTKMTAANLAMVFAPNCLRCPSSNPQEIYNNTKHEVAFIEHLIAKWN